MLGFTLQVLHSFDIFIYFLCVFFQISGNRISKAHSSMFIVVQISVSACILEHFKLDSLICI